MRWQNKQKNKSYLNINDYMSCCFDIQWQKGGWAKHIYTNTFLIKNGFHFSWQSCFPHVTHDGLAGWHMRLTTFQWLQDGSFSVSFQFAFIIMANWPTYWRHYCLFMHIILTFYSIICNFQTEQGKKQQGHVILRLDYAHKAIIFTCTQTLTESEHPLNNITNITGDCPSKTNVFLEKAIYYKTQKAGCQ